MEFGVGAMRSLLPKLGGLLLEEYKLQKDLKREIKGLMDELLVIQAVLEKVSNMPLDHLDPLVNIWANHVRDLSYAIEDNLDSFMVCGKGREPTKPRTFLRFIKKTCRKATKLKTRREIANDIKDIKIQVREVKDRYDRYKDAICNTNTKTEVDPRLMALYNKVSDLVGIDEAIEEVMKILSYHSDVSNNKLKTVSIVGFGGLGKTTLAKVVYDKLNKKFDCGGFIPVGQNPDTKKVLRDILLELDMELYRAATTMDERQMIDQLRKFLAGKRYFLVIDDIWDIPTWETVKYAFVDSHPESRIIVTTRIVDVAAKVGGIYRMEPLSDENSKMLFYTRTCGGEGVSQENQPAEVTKKILKKCGGVPLAIITIASLLVGKGGSDWSKVYDAIGFGHEDNEVVHNTRKILCFSYYDLPSDLKTCLLYLSMFPEDYYIEKKSLIWRWIAEGFVLDKEGVGSFELGEIYFNKLVNKSMIRWMDPHDFEEVQGGCVVHDMVLDLMRTISNHVNFVTIHDIEQHGTCSRGRRSSIVRRFALHGQSAEYKSNIEMQHVRSFNAITCGVSRIPPLRSFIVLRVLVIEDCVFPEGHSLEHLGKLVHLRYLGLVKTGVSKLPEGIGCDLKFLEILDVRGGLISELPWSVGELCNLRCLWADEGTVMKGNVGKLTCLEELQLHSVDKCPNFFMELGKLMELRVLDIYFDEMEQTTSKALVESLCNLRKIQSMTVRPDDESLVVLGDSLEDLAPSSHLHFFSMLRMIIPRVPSWINYLRVPLLSHLCLQVEVVDSRDIETLGRLPSLLYLILEIMERSSISYTFGSDEFHKLRWLITKKLEISMEEGALPMLEMLVYNTSARKKDVASLVPWNNGCPCLENVFCWLDCTNSGKVEVKAVEATLRQAARTHPNQVEFRIRRDNYDKKAGRLIDRLELILGGFDRPKEIDCTADKAEIRNMITSLESLLNEAAEPLVGRYGEQDIRGLVTKFKSLLHDDAGTCQEEVDDGDATSSGDNQEEGPNQPC